MEQRFNALNELEIKITNSTTKEELINETCCTAITICLNNQGDCLTSFVGAYNPEIIKLLQKVQKTYYKNLIKKLKQNNKEVVNNITKQADVTEDATPDQPEKKQKVKKVHERQTKKTAENKAENTETQNNK